MIFYHVKPAYTIITFWNPGVLHERQVAIDLLISPSELNMKIDFLIQFEVQNIGSVTIQQKKRR